jgi:hypothetical protein
MPRFSHETSSISPPSSSIAEFGTPENPAEKKALRVKFDRGIRGENRVRGFYIRVAGQRWNSNLAPFILTFSLNGEGKAGRVLPASAGSKA